MNIIFQDRLKRSNVRIGNFTVGYFERLVPYYNRAKLPSKFGIDGVIAWVDPKLGRHNTFGPTRTSISGSMKYALFDKWVSALEVAMIK